VPLQRHRAIDVALGPFSPFGGLRGLHGHPYEAHRYAALLWEHNFRTTPFEYLSLWPLVRRAMSVLVHGGTARTWDTPSGLRGTDGWHHELGLSLALYGMLRIDATRRLDDPGWRFGASFARFD
jgi:hypothetical protein